VFLDPADFPFTRALTAGFPDVLAELEALLGEHFVAWPETDLYDAGWEVFGLYAFGRRLAHNCERCPRTAALVEAVPGMVTAGFSRLAPGTHIRPHVGYSTAVLRCHLGVVTPPGCALRVGGETRAWRAGECLLFDDTAEHEAWNRGDAERVVLLLDFTRDGARRPAAVPDSVAGPLARLLGGG